MKNLRILITCTFLFSSLIIFAQSDSLYSIQICKQKVTLDSICSIDQNFQSVNHPDFRLTWIYLKFPESKIDDICREGFFIQTKKKDKINHIPTKFVVLGQELDGYIIEIIGKKETRYYLTACGNLFGIDIGIQVALNEKNEKNETLPLILRRVIEFKV